VNFGTERAYPSQQLFQAERVDDLFLFNPAAPGHLHSIAHGLQAARCVGVRGDHDFHSTFLCHAQVRVFQIEAFQRRVALHYHAVFVRGIQNAFHVIGVRVATKNQAARGMPHDLGVRIFDGRQNSIGHLRAIQIHVRVNGNEHDVELREHFVVQIQFSIFQNVHFAARENMNAQMLGVCGLDFLDLLERPLFIEPVRDGHRFAVIGQRNIFVA
jgi:hypothetical protein